MNQNSTTSIGKNNLLHLIKDTALMILRTPRSVPVSQIKGKKTVIIIQLSNRLHVTK